MHCLSQLLDDVCAGITSGPNDNLSGRHRGINGTALTGRNVIVHSIERGKVIVDHDSDAAECTVISRLVAFVHDIVLCWHLGIAVDWLRHDEIGIQLLELPRESYGISPGLGFAPCAVLDVDVDSVHAVLCPPFRNLNSHGLRGIDTC